MNPKITKEQREALKKEPGKPITIEDDQAKAFYVLLPLDTYQKVQALVGGDDFDIRETYAAQFAAVDTPECWDAPGMEKYDDYDSHKPQS